MPNPNLSTLDQNPANTQSNTPPPLDSAAA